MSRTYVSYSAAAQVLQPADVLSYRMPPFADDPLGWPLSKMIAIAGRREDIHTGVADRNTDGRWLAIGMRLGRQKLLFLEDEVTSNPGLIDVYRFRYPHGEPTEHVDYAAGYAIQSCGSSGLSVHQQRAICDTMRFFALKDHYGTWAVIRSSVYYLPFARWLAPHFGELDEDQNETPARPFCSQAVSHAFRKHAVPLLERLPDRHVLPGDIVDSPLLRYVCTLVPDPRPNTFSM